MIEHPYLKLGRRRPSGGPALMLADFLTGVVPDHPVTADHFGKLQFGLYGNDRFGVCGPTSVANLVRLVTGGLLGAEIQPSQDDVFDLYRRSGNPKFDPSTGVDDNGVDMQTMLEALLAGGIGNGQGARVTPLAFAKVDPTDDGELAAAASIFGGTLWGVELELAQQKQTDLNPPRWDYAKSGEWGGHAILNGAYEAAGIDDVISWALRVQTTPPFRWNQLQEAWIVIWPWNLDHPAFQAGVDLSALATAYQLLTGRTLPGVSPQPTPPPPPPAPAPAPAPPTEPASAGDEALWAAVSAWAAGRHTGATKGVSVALRAWAAEKGLAG